MHCWAVLYPLTLLLVITSPGEIAGDLGGTKLHSSQDSQVGSSGLSAKCFTDGPSASLASGTESLECVDVDHSKNAEAPSPKLKQKEKSRGTTGQSESLATTGANSSSEELVNKTMPFVTCVWEGPLLGTLRRSSSLGRRGLFRGSREDALVMCASARRCSGISTFTFSRDS